MPAAGSVRSQREKKPTLLLRLSRRFGDVILLAQGLGIAANLIWYLELDNSDLVGFIYVGGDIAGLFAYFGFMLFGILFFCMAPHLFWRTVHPVNFGIALMLLASHRLWNANGMLIISAALLGMLAGRFIFHLILAHPRASLIACTVIIPLERFILPSKVMPYIITFDGALLMTVVCAPLLLRALRPR